MDGSLDECLVALKEDLDKKDFMILSAMDQKDKNGNLYTDIFGIVAGDSKEEMFAIEERLVKKGVKVGAGEL